MAKKAKSYMGKNAPNPMGKWTKGGRIWVPGWVGAGWNPIKMMRKFIWKD